MFSSPNFALAERPRISRLPSLVLSAGIHGVVVGLLVAAHQYRPVAPAARSQRVVVQDHKIFWYTPPPADLPAVAPAQPAPHRPLQGKQFYPRQSIASIAQKPESRRQMVLQSPPKLRLPQDVRAPNLLVVNPPAAPALPRPVFTPPAPAPVQPKSLPDVEAPKIAAAPPAPALPVSLQPSRLPAPKFEMPKRGAPAPRRPALPLEDAPQVAVAASPNETLARLEPKPLMARPQFVAPEKTGSSRSPARPAVISESAPEVAAQQAATVIVGLNPVATPLQPLPPPGNRSAQFSAGPDGTEKGREGLSSSVRAEVRVPNLAISPAAAAIAPIVTRPGPAGSVADHAAFRRELASLAVRPTPGALSKLDPGPAGPTSGSCALLRGSTVYTLAIDMPNITSYDGSWTLRFTELGGSSPDDVLTSPVPTRKVDPKYAAAAVAEGVEGKVMLYAVIRRDGRVGQIHLVQGIDERLDSSAVAAFSKWEFQPATRNGQPVDLEAVVQIPFRAGPHRKN